MTNDDMAIEMARELLEEVAENLEFEITQKDKASMHVKAEGTAGGIITSLEFDLPLSNLYEKALENVKKYVNPVSYKEYEELMMYEAFRLGVKNATGMLKAIIANSLEFGTIKEGETANEE